MPHIALPAGFALVYNQLVVTDIRHMTSPQMLDLTGLPAQTVRQVLDLVREARETLSEPPIRSPNQDDPERWSAEWRAWIASQPRRAITIDDDRESIYAGCGE